MNAILPRNSIETIVSLRDAAVAAYATAFDQIAAADAVLKEAAGLWNAAAPTRTKRYYDDAQEVKEFFGAVSMPDRERYLRTAQRLIDISVWSYIIETTALESLMDHEAKEQLRQQMRYVPERRGRDGEIINQEEMERGLPPVTVDNIVATLERFRQDSGLIFQRGIANAFSKLDRRFRSHDGFKVGSRLILNYFCNSFGWVNDRGQRDTLIDIERTFLILDGKDPRASYGGILGRIEFDRRGGSDARQSEHEGDYFRVRIFKNGNAHLWFTRKDLVEKVNKILADYYGEVIGDGMTKEADPFKEVKTTPARYFGFFPTPPAAADELLSKTSLLQEIAKPPLRILEPSAGTGNLARRCLRSIETLDGWSGGRARYAAQYRFDNKVDCVEIQAHLAAALEAEGIYNRVICQDFLSLRPDPTNLYDRVVMNPPFDRERDIDHVMHALDFLKPDGQLVAIMSAGTEFRETRKCIAFRERMQKLGASWSDLPPGSFAESGTYVNTVILSVWKNGRPGRRW
jgi:hypothetical protein